MKTATFQIPDKEYGLFLAMAEKLGAVFQQEVEHKEFLDDKEKDEWARNYKSETFFENDTTERLGRRVSGQRKQASASELEEAKKFMISHTNGFKGVPDPSAWQREIRQDRPLPGRV